MVKTLSKIGNSAGITLDKAVLELAHLKLGDKVTVTVRNGSIVLTPANVGFSDDEIDGAADAIFKRYDKAFKKLAE